MPLTAHLPPQPLRLQKQVRYLISFFMVGLILSGITAFPIEWELKTAHSILQQLTRENELARWIERVYLAVKQSNLQHPFLAYGTDWLAFAHLVIAVVFVGPLRDPIRNKWVIEFGLIACLAVFPLALIAGEVRQIPIYWRMVDCSFGMVGGIVLGICYSKINALEKQIASI